jgi:hypothetical protein
LRSTNKHVDVSEIAFDLGGGGHRNASGIKLSYIANSLPGETYDTGNLYNELKNIYYDVLTINNKTYNVVYLSCSIYRRQLGLYLLQDKYLENGNGNLMQMCMNISRKINKEYPNNVQISCVWYYNPINDTTEMTITLHKSINDQEKLVIDDWFTQNVNQYIMYKGLQMRIPLDKSLIYNKI